MSYRCLLFVCVCVYMLFTFCCISYWFVLLVFAVFFFFFIAAKTNTHSFHCIALHRISWHSCACVSLKHGCVYQLNTKGFIMFHSSFNLCSRPFLKDHLIIVYALVDICDINKLIRFQVKYRNPNWALPMWSSSGNCPDSITMNCHWWNHQSIHFHCSNRHYSVSMVLRIWHLNRVDD